MRPCDAGIGHVLLCADGVARRIRFRTRKAGMFTVERAGDGYTLSLPAWKPAPRPLDAIVAALGIDFGAVVETLWHPYRYGVVVLADETAVRARTPDSARWPKPAIG